MDQATRLRQMVQKKIEPPTVGARVIAVTSGKGGVGKTSFSVNLAIDIAKTGKKVVIFDADFGLANVEVMLGIRPRHNLLDVINHDMSINDVITKGPGDIGFISGGSGVSEFATLDGDSIRTLISELSRLDSMYDVVIIDTGAGITDSVMEFVMVSPEVVLVVTPEPTSITDAYSLLKVLRKKDGFNPLYKTISVVTNRVDSEREGIEIYNKINMVSSKYLNTKLNYLGPIVFDKNVSMAIIEQKPVIMAHPSSQAAKCINNIAKKFTNSEQTEYSEKSGIAKMFMDFFKYKRKSK